MGEVHVASLYILGLDLVSPLGSLACFGLVPLGCVPPAFASRRKASGGDLVGGGVPFAA